MDKGFPEILNSHHMTQKFHTYIVNKLKNADSQRHLQYYSSNVHNSPTWIIPIPTNLMVDDKLLSSSADKVGSLYP